MPEFISLLRKIRDVYYPQIRDIMDTVISDFETKRNEFSIFVNEKTIDFQTIAEEKTNALLEFFNTSIETIDAKKDEIVTYISEQRTAISSTISDFTTYATSLISSIDTKKSELDTVATQLENIYVVDPVETLPPINGMVANAEVEYNRLNGGMKFKIPAGRNGQDLAIDFVVASDAELYALTMDSANAKYVSTGTVAYREDTEMVYVKKDTGQNTSSVDWTDGAPLTPTTLFKNLSDTPETIESLKIYRGNSAGDSLEQITPKQIAESQELQDISNIPENLTGEAKKVVVVNDTEDGFSYSEDTQNALLLEGKTKEEIENETIAILRGQVEEEGNTLEKLDNKKAEKNGNAEEDFTARKVTLSELSLGGIAKILKGLWRIEEESEENPTITHEVEVRAEAGISITSVKWDGYADDTKTLTATHDRWEFNDRVKIKDGTLDDEAASMRQLREKADITTTQSALDGKAEKNGSTTETFSVADGVDDIDAVNVGQTISNIAYLDVKETRELGTEYTNTKSYPMIVYFVIKVTTSGNAQIFASIDGMVVWEFRSSEMEDDYIGTTLIVPPNGTYEVQISNVDAFVRRWVES